MKLRKTICLLLTLAMVASATACGGAGAEAPAGGSTTEEVKADSASPETDTAPAPDAAEAAGTAAAAAAAGSTAKESAAEEIPAEDVSVTWEDSRVYTELTLGKYDTIPTFGVKGYEDVPFIRASDYLALLFEGRQNITRQDGVLTVSVNDTEAVIDPAADTIRFENPSRLRSAGPIDGAIVEDSEYNVVTRSAKNESVQTDAVPLTVSLRDYHMPVIPYEDDILLPFLALQNTFGSVCMMNVLAYNGKDYYNAFEANNFLTEEGHENAKDSPYIKALFSGPFSEKTETTQAYADYGYYSICLLLDLTFGHKEEKDITTFDEYFTRMNAKPALCSTNPSYAMTSEIMLFNYLFDSGHDSVFSMDTVFGKIDPPQPADIAPMVEEIKNSEEGRQLFDSISEEDMTPSESINELELDAIMGALLEKGFKIPEVVPLFAWTLYFDKNKPADYGDERLDYAGDTAVIYFNAFKDDTGKRVPSYYLDPVKKEDEKTSSFAFFYNCFEDIKQHDEVKNVVINLSDNGGGNASALIAVLGFLSEDGEVKITDRDLMAGNYRQEYYHVDTNLDGVADDQDGFGGQYDFYIMCSGSSYSCANAMPYFAQKQGLAKIIGTKPGGGDCVVGSFIDAYGRCAVYSGMLKLGEETNGEFVSDEKATEVDLNMMPFMLDVIKVPWYNPEGIADAVHQYQNGVTEMVWDYTEESEQISEFLENLFAELEKAKEEAEAGATAETAAEEATAAAAETAAEETTAAETAAE